MHPNITEYLTRKKPYTYTPSTDNICILITATGCVTINEYGSTMEKGGGTTSMVTKCVNIRIGEGIKPPNTEK